MNSFEEPLPKEIPKQVTNEKIKTPEEIIEFRYNQSYASRLAEFITGLRPDDPKFAERIALDYKIIREKYSLPARELRWEAPVDYEHFLRERAAKDNIKLRDTSDCGNFFKKNPHASGVFFDNRNEIGSTINKENIESYAKSLGILEHEFIHAEQQITSPRMPIELMEYEAYIAGINPKYTKDYESAEVLFSFLVGGSVRHWYREKNEERKPNEQELIAVYEDPDYFLKNIDHIDESIIEEYKKKNSKKHAVGICTILNKLEKEKTTRVGGFFVGMIKL